MCEELKLEKIDNSSWGFRLTGGMDFGTPLTVIKVTGGSIAELSGVQVGDLVVEINGHLAKSFSHTDAQNCIAVAGNYLTLKVMRGSIVTPPNVTPLRGMTPALDTERVDSPDIPYQFNAHMLQNQLASVANGSTEDRLMSPAIVKENSAQTAELHHPQFHENRELGIDVTDSELAELLSGNEEVLDQGILGINFQKFLPQVDFIRQSEVFKNENTWKEVPEEVQLQKEPTKRFSTFLMKPKAPPTDKPKGPFWHYPKAPRYLPKERPKEPETPARKFFKDKPKEDDGHTVLWLFLEETGERVIDEKWGSAEEERLNLSRNENRDDESTASKSSTRCSTRIGFTSNVENEDVTAQPKKLEFDVETNITEKTVEVDHYKAEDNEESTHKKSSADFVELSSHSTEETMSSEAMQTDHLTSESNLVIAEKLADIQTQISALEEQVPGDLRTKLLAVQNQLTKILNVKSTVSAMVKLDSHVERIEEYQSFEEAHSTKEEKYEKKESTYQKEVVIGDERISYSEDGGESASVREEQESCHEKEESNKEISEISAQEEANEEIIEGYEKGEYEICEAPPPPQETPKKRPAHPITPQMRPIVLPGGRMWKKPKDAAHEEFYTGILVTQADVLVGSNEGVNFSKYVPPKFDMTNSAVYRLVQEIEEKAKGKKDKLEEEYYQKPIDKRHFYLATLPGPTPIGVVELENM